MSVYISVAPFSLAQEASFPIMASGACEYSLYMFMCAHIPTSLQLSHVHAAGSTS